MVESLTEELENIRQEMAKVKMQFKSVKQGLNGLKDETKKELQDICQQIFYQISTNVLSSFNECFMAFQQIFYNILANFLSTVVFLIW